MITTHYERYLRGGGEPFAAEDPAFVDPPTLAPARGSEERDSSEREAERGGLLHEAGGSVSPASKSGEDSTEEEVEPFPMAPSATFSGSRCNTPPSDADDARRAAPAPVMVKPEEKEEPRFGGSGAMDAATHLRVKCGDSLDFDVFGMTDYLDSPDSVLPGHALHPQAAGHPNFMDAMATDPHPHPHHHSAGMAAFERGQPSAHHYGSSDNGHSPHNDAISNFFEAGGRNIHGYLKHTHSHPYGGPQQVARTATLPLQDSPYSIRSSLSNVMLSQVISASSPPLQLQHRSQSQSAQRSLHFAHQHHAHQRQPWGVLDSGTALNRAQTSALEMIDQATRCASHSSHAGMRPLSVIQSEMLLPLGSPYPPSPSPARGKRGKEVNGSQSAASKNKRKACGSKATGKGAGVGKKKAKKASGPKGGKASASPSSGAMAAARGERQRTSKFRGVSRHRLTRRWEASCWVQRKQLYLGGFDEEEKAARAYDVAALVCKGADAQINFHIKDYVHHLEMLRLLSQEELVAHIRRQSSAFSRGKSKYRGVSGHELRWEARIGQFEGKKNVSFGIYEKEEEAARQYDRALVIARGRSAKTNFALRFYCKEVQAYDRFIASLPSAQRQRARQTTTLPLSPAQGGLQGSSSSPTPSTAASESPSSSTEPSAASSATAEAAAEGKPATGAVAMAAATKKKKGAGSKTNTGSGPALIFAEQLKRALQM